eukprot:CAMPEP_0174279428 /NCGR_PEP_ID=MMETSP0439-20130205/62027_1 /TAXON_ID=0 /ORGANISM="Stereomyxa ramosa, Strain Chinc5" /LENGTH=457 /DNA_ID=CAMNT_0015371951 /DNA_START=889 /DNA_END=2262 /DNA_ORIENTATION=-
MPLSFATILGGSCTILGTSVNLIVSGLDQKEEEDSSWPMFEVGYVAVPVLVVGLIYILIFSRWLLPVRNTTTQSFIDHSRSYTTTLQVQKSLSGKSIAECGFDSEDTHIIELWRVGSSEAIEAPDGSTTLLEDDIVFFAAPIEELSNVLATGDLILVDQQQVSELPIRKRIMAEVVIGHDSSLIGKTVKKAKFRSKFKAAVVAVHRKGANLNLLLNSLKLRVGDTLLLQTGEVFFNNLVNHHDFAMVRKVEGTSSLVPPFRPFHSFVAAVGVIVLITLTSLGVLPLAIAALFVAFSFVLLDVLTISEAYSAVKLKTLVIVASGFSIANGMIDTGAAEAISDSLIGVFQKGGDITVLFALFIMTALLSSVIYPTAAVTLMFPIAQEFQSEVGIQRRAVLYVLMLGGASCFITPFSYATNLMVAGAGGYSVLDFFKFGVGLLILSCITSVTLTYFIFDD